MIVFLNYLEKLLLLVLFLLLSGIVLVIGMQVFYRYALGSPLTWSEEVARYLMVWFSLFGAAVGIRHYSHVWVDFFVDRLPLKLRLFSKALGQIVSLIFIATITLKGGTLTADKFFMPSPATSLPLGIAYLSIPVSGVFMLIFQLETMINDFFPKSYLSRKGVGQILKESGGPE